MVTAECNTVAAPTMSDHQQVNHEDSQTVTHKNEEIFEKGRQESDK